MSITAAILTLCMNPVATDGDNIRCSNGDDARCAQATSKKCLPGVRLRLAGVQAPDTPAYCASKGRTCTQAQWQDSKNNLSYLLLRGPVYYRVVGDGLFNRRAAVVFAGKTNLSCQQVIDGHATFAKEWGGKHLDCDGKKKGKLQ